MSKPQRISRTARLWSDESGFIISTELVLLATILIIGLIVGLAAVRDATVSEFGDVAASIGRTNQSFRVSGVVGHSAAVSGFGHVDRRDFGEQDDPTGNGITVNRPGTFEGTD